MAVSSRISGVGKVRHSVFCDGEPSKTGRYYVDPRYRTRVRDSTSTAHDTCKRAARGGVELLFHAPCFVREAAGLDGEFHGASHLHGVFRGGDGGVHQHAIGSQLHGNSGVAGGADTGIDDHGYFVNHLAENAEVGRVLYAKAAADG